MPWLAPDDDVRRLEAVWVNKTGQAQARFVTWGVFAATSGAVAPLLAFAVPTFVLVGGAAHACGYGLRRSKTGALVTVLAWLLALLMLPFGFLLHPLPWLLALLVAPVLGLVVTNRFMRWVRYETPVRYWVDTAKVEVASYRGTDPTKVAVKGPTL